MPVSESNAAQTKWYDGLKIVLLVGEATDGR